MKGYKAFDKNLQCWGIQFEVGSETKHNGNIEICGSGFHFCTNLIDCFSYYDYSPDTRICEIEALGNTLGRNEDSKHCTDLIKLIRELTWEEVQTAVNTGSGNTGYGNSGDQNSGNLNSGDLNSGDRNSGDQNSGNRNSGDQNSGDRNSGDWNSGDRNSGDRNSGDLNSGYRNSGYLNSGSFNKCNYSAGFFNTETQKVQVFNGPLVDREAFIKHPGYQALISHNFPLTEWVSASNMSEEDKKAHPKWEVQEGYLKVNSYETAWEKLWSYLDDRDKKAVQDLPGFNWEVFTQITGIQKAPD